MARTRKCAHPACNCVPADGSKYCSQYCADAKDTTEIACNCGHAGCAWASAAAGASPLEVGGEK